VVVVAAAARHACSRIGRGRSLAVQDFVAYLIVRAMDLVREADPSGPGDAARSSWKRFVFGDLFGAVFALRVVGFEEQDGVVGAGEFHDGEGFADPVPDAGGEGHDLQGEVWLVGQFGEMLELVAHDGRASYEAAQRGLVVQDRQHGRMRTVRPVGGPSA